MRLKGEHLGVAKRYAQLTFSPLEEVQKWILNLFLNYFITRSTAPRCRTWCGKTFNQLYNMKASETKLQKLIEGTHQYVVPLFQREYSWKEKNWIALWQDILDLWQSSTDRAHFIGSIVTMQTQSVPEGVAKYLLIDGQQRFTTVFILLAAIRDVIQPKNSKFAEQIENRFLINPYEENNERFKLFPTQTDREAFADVINAKERKSEKLICKAYRFFQRNLRDEPMDGIPSLVKIITEKLSVVSITLDADDDPYLVFESLNAKGEPLTQSDLIRNYLFMKIPVNQQEKLNTDFWQPMQNALGEQLTNFIRHYLTKKGVFVKQSEIYFFFKEELTETSAIEKLRELSKFASYYTKLLSPEEELDAEIHTQLLRFKRLEATTAYPFLLNCYDDYAEKRITVQDFVDILKTLENYLIRRFVCGIPTNQLNKIFLPLYAQAKEKNTTNKVAGAQKVLQSKGYPKDYEFRKNLIEGSLYGGGDRLTKTKLILDSLEESFNHKEQALLADFTIEHILPQTLDQWWKTHLGDDYEFIQDQFLHTLGNLTLTKYNSELSNLDFDMKKKILADSKLNLNQYFSELEAWRVDEIQKRASDLADKAISIWSYFGEVNIESEKDAKEELYTLDTMHNGDYLQGDLLDLFNELRYRIFDLSRDVKEEIQKQTIAYKKSRTFLSVVPLKKSLKLYLNMNYSELMNPTSLCEDVSRKGHWGTGDVQVKFSDSSQLDEVMQFVRQAFEKNIK